MHYESVVTFANYAAVTTATVGIVAGRPEGRENFVVLVVTVCEIGVVSGANLDIFLARADDGMDDDWRRKGGISACAWSIRMMFILQLLHRLLHQVLVDGDGLSSRR